MGKKKNKQKQKRKKNQAKPSLPPFSWMGNDGLHCLMPGEPSSPEQLEKMTQDYQKQIKNSPLWDEMVRQFGKEKAEELLKQCRAELR